MRPETRRRHFWRQIEVVEGEHWHWTGYRVGGPESAPMMTWDDGKKQYVDRIAYELVRGPLPAGARLYTSAAQGACGDAQCLNPYHRVAVIPSAAERRAHAILKLLGGARVPVGA